MPPAGIYRILAAQKAAGLNRLGFIREKSIRQESLVREASYFGVMTASPEESVEEAHKALNSDATDLPIRPSTGG